MAPTIPLLWCEAHAYMARDEVAKSLFSVGPTVAFSGFMLAVDLSATSKSDGEKSSESKTYLDGSL